MNLKAVRKSKKLTQRQLGEAVGVKRESIARYESGDRRPSYEVLVRIAHALGIPVMEMLEIVYGPMETVTLVSGSTIQGSKCDFSKYNQFGLGFPAPNQGGETKKESET